jgi:hypothetical protein
VLLSTVLISTVPINTVPINTVTFAAGASRSGFGGGEVACT